jgi:hypothetical protein
MVENNSLALKPVMDVLDFNLALNMPIEVLRDTIGELEVILNTLPQTDCPLKHYFSPGVYGREIFMPKGSLVIGKIHKNQTMNIISVGEISILSIDGVIRVKAPYTFVSSPGAKRVVYMHTDCIWTTFHGTHETDLGKIEDEIIAKTYDDVYVSLEDVKNLMDVSEPIQIEDPVVTDIIIEEIV